MTRLVSPPVTVLMSTLNQAQYLYAATASILNQTYEDFEFIIIDDGSTDETAAILDGFSDPRIVRVHNKQPSTLPVALNQGLALARGEFIARMDGDDIALPERLEQQIAFLEQNSQVGVVGTQVSIIDGKGRAAHHQELPQTHSMIVWRLFTGFALAHPSVMMRRALVEQLGGYNPEYVVSQDRELWMRAMWYTRFANLPTALMQYRTHPKSATSQKTGNIRDLSYRPAQNFFREHTSQEVDLALLKRIFGRHYLYTLHSDTDAQAAAQCLIRLYQALTDHGLLISEELREVQTDLAAQVMALGRQSPTGVSYLVNSIRAFAKYLIRGKG